jgi:ABC-type nitrate/sulfonate/bicarbonate transport system permease component
MNPARWIDLLGQAAVLGVLLAAWDLTARAGWIAPFLLPPFGEVIARVVEDAGSGELAANAALTLYRALVGCGLAALIGIPLGIVMARITLARWFFDPLVSIGFPMPKIAFLPIFMLWFGLYDASKIAMIAFSSVFAIVAASAAGTRGVDRFTLWSARALGTSEHALLWEIVLPAALPQILTGLQIALPVALITTIVTEMLMGGPGVGGAMIQAGRFADSVGVYAGIVEIAVLGIAVIKLVEAARRRLLRWHPEVIQAAR